MFKPTFWYEQVIHMQVLQLLTVGNPLLTAACAAELLMQRNSSTKSLQNCLCGDSSFICDSTTA